MDEVNTIEVKPLHVLYIRRKGPYSQIRDMIQEITQFAFTNGVKIAGPPLFICHETSPEEAKKAGAEGKADLEVALPVVGDTRAGGQIKSRSIVGGKMARIVHQGPYEACQVVYEKVFDWIQKNDLKVTGPVREVYLNDPSRVPPEKILTEILVPVE